MTTWITICDTCKSDHYRSDESAQTCGERFAQKIEKLAETQTELKTRRVSCMMGCKRACNVSVQDGQKISYVLGEFDPSDANAQAVVEYALAHAHSQSGQVPFREWPEGVKGHFTARLAPLPKGA